MRVFLKSVLVVVALVVLGFVLSGYFHDHPVAILSPAGTVASEQRGLIIFATLLSLIVIVPVFALTFFIVWRYRETNTKPRRTPDWDHHGLLEFTWWTIPSIIILVLSVVTWQSSYALDPFKPLLPGQKAVNVQVVALQWKWLFIYPDQQVASVNYFRFPSKTPVHFEITADAPMNSFWIPRLGGQIYAMSGMSTQLNLLANGNGRYRGSSANLSGAGFADMHFTAESTSRQSFNDWVKNLKRSGMPLTEHSYEALARPNAQAKPSFYSLKAQGLYDTIVMKYMMPGGVGTTIQ